MTEPNLQSWPDVDHQNYPWRKEPWLLVRYVVFAIHLWRVGLTARSAYRYHRRHGIRCPTCGKRWTRGDKKKFVALEGIGTIRDTGTDPGLESPIIKYTGDHPEYLATLRASGARAEALVCAGCGDWWVNTCPHDRVHRMPLGNWCDDHLCLGCGQMLGAKEVYAAEVRRKQAAANRGRKQ